jgi:hypothetical protein
MAETCDVSTKHQAEYCRRLTMAAHKINERLPSGAQSRLRTLLLRTHQRLARPPRLLLAGEFNSGKSLLANLLIGESIVPTSIVPNSQFPVRFHFAPRPSLGAVLEGRSQNLAWSQLDHVARSPVERIEVGLPLERLRKFEVIDTPGISSPLWKGEHFERQLPLAHLPIWVTAASRAWRESERQTWLRLSETQRRRGLMLVTQIDLLPGSEDLALVLERLATETADLFQSVIPMSLPDAITSSVMGSERQSRDAWTKSGGAQLERALTSALEEIAAQRVASAKRALLRAISRRRLQGASSATAAWPKHLDEIASDLDLPPFASSAPPTKERGDGRSSAGGGDHPNVADKARDAAQRDGKGPYSRERGRIHQRTT